MISDNSKVHHECGNGWKNLIDPLIARADFEGAMVMQIKEKFGQLRVYIDGASDDLEERCDEATRQSTKICEMCGKPGHLMTKAHWLKTLCPEHSLDLDYREKV